MKKYDNFCNCFKVLKNADFNLARENEIYRTGVIGQFQLTFELAWKALRYVLNLYGVDLAKTGLPREILKAGFAYGFLNNESVWLEMLKSRNISSHIYNESDIDRVILSIQTGYIDAFENLKITLAEKIAAAEEGLDSK